VKTILTFALLAISASPTFAQQGIANRPPKAFGPVKTIRYEYHSCNFSRDKTRIEEVLSNDRTLLWSFTLQGKLVSSEAFERDGRASGTKSLYTYDTGGRLALIVHYLGLIQF